MLSELITIQSQFSHINLTLDEGLTLEDPSSKVSLVWKALLEVLSKAEDLSKVPDVAVRVFSNIKATNYLR